MMRMSFFGDIYIEGNSKFCGEDDSAGNCGNGFYRFKFFGEVENTLVALHELAAHHRNSFLSIISITREATEKNNCEGMVVAIVAR